MDELEQESGGHRIQRVPPTERRGRVHTSTVTVAVLPLASEIVDSQDTTKAVVLDADIIIEWFSGTGAGGQHRNKKQCSCRLRHVPTGIITTAQTRSRDTSYQLAYAELVERVTAAAEARSQSETNAERSSQIGSGMRGDKIRTYRFQDDQAKDHRTGRTVKCSHVMRGNFRLFWK